LVEAVGKTIGEDGPASQADEPAMR